VRDMVVTPPPKILPERFGREKAPEDSEAARRALTHIRFRR